MLLRSGFEYISLASSSTSSSITSTRSSRKRKSGEDALDKRPLKRQYATLNLLGDLSDASPLSPPVAPPSLSSYPPPSSPSPSETPFVREDSCASDATVPVDDASSEGTVALEDEAAGDERGPRRVHFGSNVIEYLFEADDEPRRVVELRHFARLRDEHTHSQNMPEHRILFVFFPCNTPTKAHRTGLIISGFIGTNLAVIAMEIDYSHMDIHSATIFKLDTAVYAPGNTGYLAVYLKDWWLCYSIVLKLTKQRNSIINSPLAYRYAILPIYPFAEYTSKLGKFQLKAYPQDSQQRALIWAVATLSASVVFKTPSSLKVPRCLGQSGSTHCTSSFSSVNLQAASTTTIEIVTDDKNHRSYTTKMFSDTRTLVTDGTENLACICQFKNETTTTDLALLECLKAYMIYLQDKAAIAWKFNRTRYVKKLDGHKNVVEIIQIKPYCKLLRSSSDPPSASTSTTSTRSSRKRKSGEDDALDTRPLKKQYATLDLLGDLSDASPLSPPVASPSSFSYPPPSSPSSSEAPFVREDSCASDATVPVDDASPEGTVALEDETAGGERGPQRLH
ncbi:hypothetical protein MUCCIDRAFT_189923 [Mucor lusitanicus CBS 277.49]|uniref:Uncharacterized protein n=1 Tax=Mucor lusitanicus CBS 277.49 TaxID=747725 RepID=A0A168JZY8_MUCCL|nr:hypothetical protein MUCCIDRAFT_189923 [Mucor lusitanicus CBS 277.49]